MQALIDSYSEEKVNNNNLEANFQKEIFRSQPPVPSARFKDLTSGDSSRPCP